jgi:hypothetical protein
MLFQGSEQHLLPQYPGYYYLLADGFHPEEDKVRRNRPAETEDAVLLMNKGKFYDT